MVLTLLKLSIALRVQGIKPVTLSTDNYFVEREVNPIDENGNYDFECLEALDLDLLNSQLVDLLNGKEVQLPTFDFMVGTKKYLGNTLKLHPDASASWLDVTEVSLWLK